MTVVRWAATALVVAGTIAWTLSDFLLGLTGALAGLLLGLAAAQGGLALGAVLFGLRITNVIIGVGSEVKAWTSPNRRVVLRGIPVLATIGLSGRKPGVRRRTVLTGVFAAVLCAAVAAATWLTVGTAFGKGLALATTACFLVQLVPVEKPAYVSIGWFAFSLPRLTGRRVAELEARPRVMAGMDAYHRGDLDEAERIYEDLAREHPDLLTVVGLEVATRCAREKYLEALQTVIALNGREDLGERELAFVLATTAGVAVYAVEAGQFPAEVGLETARSMLGNAYRAGYPKSRSNGTLAIMALLEGDTATARQLAGYAAEASESGTDRADDLVTIARAWMADGDNARARELVAEAHELAAWSPRVAATRARLQIS
ncbi:hypothetical protein V1227_34530 [Lentzea sp. DG1S-22]|uniref:hypothetical protein n=1 Tax=Lentzea sp. DG1S-22 TaxID=3108822 RepID=UPI002E77C65B|nr:hypothetical protein [Lentzea sp. DG1S-22]WVH80084.1 hypothetical protein V1227_34530 [Lentzea sp. DG1S-22]